MSWLASAAVVAGALIVAACGSSGGSGGAPVGGGSAATGGALNSTTINGTTVLTNAKGFTLYSFAPDTSTTSKCNGTCAQIWPPVTGPVTARAGVTGKLGTIKRSNGALQATYNGHPVYAYTADTAPGQATGNGVNASGGIWHEVTVSGAAAPSPSSGRGGSSGGGGYGY